MSDESTPDPGFDPPLRAKRPKLTEEEKEQRRLERELARLDKAEAKRNRACPHIAAALKIADPEAREIEGRRLHAEIGEQKAALIAERQALLDRPAYDPAEIEERLGPAACAYERFSKSVYGEASKLYMEELDRLAAEIDAVSAEQVEISWAYARPELKAGYAAMSPWIEAAVTAALWRRRLDEINAEDARLGPWDKSDADETMRPLRPARRQHERLYVRPRAEAEAAPEAPEASAAETAAPWLIEPEAEPVVWGDESEEIAERALETLLKAEAGQVDDALPDEGSRIEEPPQAAAEAPKAPEASKAPAEEEPPIKEPEEEEPEEPTPDYLTAAKIVNGMIKALKAHPVDARLWVDEREIKLARAVILAEVETAKNAGRLKAAQKLHAEAAEMIKLALKPTLAEAKQREAEIERLAEPLIALIRAEIEDALRELHDTPLANKFGRGPRNCREIGNEVCLWKGETKWAATRESGSG